MAPSPELGQPKAPDKMFKTNKVSPADADGLSGAGATTGHVTTVQREKKSMNATTANAATIASSTQPADAENFGNWDDNELKKLLDEAITYKRPKDREHKSETFKELLQHAELEDQARADCYIHCVSSRVNRGSSRHHQSGSLQDLVEAVHSEHLLESDFSMGSQSRRNHHNSRQKKYSSVSSRGREGGSLPSNVNCNLCPYEESFLKEFNKRNSKLDKTKNSAAAVTAAAANTAARQDSHCVWVGYDTQPSDNKISHTVIEIESEETRHLLAHDSLAQGLSESSGTDDGGGTELNPMKKMPRIAVNYATHQLMTLDVSIGESMSSARSSSQHQHIVDKTVDFNAILKKTPTIDANPVQLKNSYPAVNSCIDQTAIAGAASSAITTTTTAASQPILPVVSAAEVTKGIDENGNSVFPGGKLKPKPKQNKFDRNTRTLKAEEIIGNRGGDDIKQLLAFIENKETTRKNGMIATNGNEKNKKDKTGKKDGHNTTKSESQLKKSNSLEELKSSSKLEEEKESEQVRRILRQKQQMTKKNSAMEIKDNQKHQQQQQQHRRGERRSWGTEELTYLGETNVTVPKKDDVVAVAKDVSKKPQNAKFVENSGKPAVTIQRQKSEEHSLSIVSIESISTSSETAEFHVVTKKKKAKKRQIFEEARQKHLDRVDHHIDASTSTVTPTGHHRSSKYHPSQSYANERGGDMYLSSFSANDRRKSTSSVPPSDKSDSSDLDSVHSLPIESTIRLRNSAIASTAAGQPSATQTAASVSNGASTAQISYADIARFSNPDKGLALNATSTSTDKWPTVSAVKSAENVATVSISETFVPTNQPKHSSRTVRTIAYTTLPEPVTSDSQTNPSSFIDPTATAVNMPITYSQSLTDDNKQMMSSNHHHDEHKRMAAAATMTPHTAVSTASVYSAGNNSSLPPPGKSQRLVDIIKSSNTSDSLAKNPLQKSKSCDNDNYVNMSIDQYPALEQTVKPQKQYQIIVPLVEQYGAKMLSNTGNRMNVAVVTASAPAASVAAQLVSSHNATNVQPAQLNLIKKAKTTNAISTFKQPNPGQQPKVTTASNKKTIPTKLEDNQSAHSDRTVASAPSTTSTLVARKLTKKSKLNAAALPANHNRPAVIIMNDNCEYSDKISPLLFGDLTDELRRLLEQDSNDQEHVVIEGDALYANGSPEPKQQTNTMPSSSPPPPSSTFSQEKSGPSGNDDGSVASSPQSDQGYGSCSTASLTLDRSSLSNNTSTVDESTPIPPSCTSTTTDKTSDGALTPPLNLSSSSSLSSSCNANLVSSLFKNNSKNNSTTASNIVRDSAKNCAKSAVNRNAEGVFVDPSIVFAVADGFASSADGTISATAAVAAVAATNSSSEKSIEMHTTLRFVAPPKSDTVVNYNHEKIVNFVGMEWENVMCAGAKFYNGN